MGAGGTVKDSLHIGRFTSQYIISSEHPAPEQVKSSLDEAAQESLSYALSSFLANCFDEGDAAVWIIRRLELDVGVNAAWDRDTLTRQWSAQIARSLVAEMGGGTDGQNALRFEDRSDYVAHFLEDVAEGCAWSKWYYRSFDGLRMLPVSAALRTILCEDAGRGLEVLLRLSSAGFSAVLRALTEQDTRTVLLSIAAAGRRSGEAECLESVCSVLAGGDDVMPDEKEGTAALNIYLRVCRRQGQLSGATLKDVVLSVVRLAGLLLSASAAHRDGIIEAVTNGNAAALYERMSAGDAEALAPLTRCPAELVLETVAVIAARCPGAERPQPDSVAAVGPVRDTRFGGIFLLLPLLAEFPLEEAARGWPEGEVVSTVPLLRILIISKCFGQSQAFRVFTDPLVRDLTGNTPRLSLSSLSDWQEKITGKDIEQFSRTVGVWAQERGFEQEILTPESLPDFFCLPAQFHLSHHLDFAVSLGAQAVLTSFARRLPGFSKSGPEHLLRNFLDFTATLEEEAERRVVRLGKPPLNIILNMTGMGRGAYRIGWLDERPFALFQEDA
jgi:hypothetical protein